MSMNRRSLLRGSAAAALTAATGGGTAAKAALSGATAISGLTMAERVARVLETCGRTAGGFPHGALGAIWRQVGRGDDSALRARINGEAPWKRSEFDGVIDFSTEQFLLNSLRELPPDLPIMDLLLEDVIGSQIEGPQNNSGYFFGILLKDSPTVSVEQVRAIQRFLEPLCDENTTADALTGKLETFFVRLARHAIAHPADFESPRKISGLKNLIDIMEQNRVAEQDLLDSLKAADKSYEPIRQKHAKESLSKHLQEEQEKRARLKEAFEAQKSCLDRRDTYPVRLIATGGNRFVITGGGGNEVPTRMDWLQWLQQLDPQYAKPADIELDHMGLTVTVKNEKALAKINEAFRSDKLLPTAIIYLPNRRMDKDLHGERIMDDLFRKDAAAYDPVRSSLTDLPRIK